MNASFYRKVIYGGLIVLLWFPLAFIGAPPEVTDQQERRLPGVLANLRDKYSLSQANLGEIDPTSESMKLATLGMRNVAVTYLWYLANYYKDNKDFDNMSASINQITLLAPNFIDVWTFQSHNESYNVSVEYDDYRMRYAWVKKGIDLLARGIKYNRKDTRLLSQLSWFFGHKIGRADESEQYRRLFHEDADYHAQLSKSLSMSMNDPDVLGVGQKPDNWLVARKVQLKAVDLVENKNVPIRGKIPLLFYSSAPMDHINFGRAIEKEGHIGPLAAEHWRQSSEEWKAYGQRPLQSTWGHPIMLGEYERYRKQAKDLEKKLDEEIAPGVRETILNERRAQLKPASLEALDTPADKRTDQQMELAYDASFKLRIRPDEIAARAPADKLRDARLVARQQHEAEDMATKIDRYREIVNFGYWQMRCDVERSPEALAGRQFIYDALQARTRGELEADAAGKPGAKELFEKAWLEWAKVFKNYPEMQTDIEMEELLDAILTYQKLMADLDRGGLPADFPLAELLRIQSKMGRYEKFKSLVPPAPPLKKEEAPAEKDK